MEGQRGWRLNVLTRRSKGSHEGARRTIRNCFPITEVEGQAKRNDNDNIKQIADYIDRSSFGA